MKGPCGGEIFVSEEYENDHALDFLTSNDSVLEGGKGNDSLARSVSRGIDSREFSWSISVPNKKGHHHSTKEFTPSQCDHKFYFVVSIMTLRNNVFFVCWTTMLQNIIYKLRTTVL